MRLRKTLFMLAVLPLLSSLFWCSPAIAGSPVYTDEVTEYVLTESQYKKLSDNLTELAKINEKYKTLLEKSKGQLGTSDKKLAELEKKCEELNSLCLSLKVKTTEQEQLLQSANQSLAELEKEYNLKIKRIKKQRNIAYVIAGCALYAALKN